MADFTAKEAGPKRLQIWTWKAGLQEPLCFLKCLASLEHLPVPIRLEEQGIHERLDAGNHNFE